MFKSAPFIGGPVVLIENPLVFIGDPQLYIFINITLRLHHWEPEFVLSESQTFRMYGRASYGKLRVCNGKFFVYNDKSRVPMES